MKHYETHTLSNGLRIVHRPVGGNVAYCGFFINAGTRDEKDGEHGLAHFIEHMLFKGTQKRKSHHIINRMENVGGELNAYTNKEETVIYSVFLKEHFGRAFELLSDLCFNSQFPQNEIEKEVEVIIDEIHSYEDSPSELIYDEFENLLFSGSELGHNILGIEKSLLTFNTRIAKSFVEKLYVPENIVFFSMGDVKFKSIVAAAEKHLALFVSGGYENKRVKPVLPQPMQNIENKDTSQVHALIGAQSYPIHEPKRKVLHLLNNILGGPGMNSRLNISLREKRGYVYNVESNITAYSDTGIFTLYFGCDERNLDKCLDLANKELKKICTNKLTDLQLAAAKKQLIGQIGISSDNRENVALALGKSFFYNNHINTLEEIFKKIDNITSSQLQEVANEIFDENKLFSLIYN